MAAIGATDEPQGHTPKDSRTSVRDRAVAFWATQVCLKQVFEVLI